MPHRKRTIWTVVAVYLAFFLVALALLEWIVIDQRSFGMQPRWDPFVVRMGYLVPIGIATALSHGLCVTLFNEIRKKRGRSARRPLMLPITAGLSGVLLMVIEAVPNFFTGLSDSVFGVDSILEYLILPLGIGFLSTAVAVLLGATGGGLRGRR